MNTKRILAAALSGTMLLCTGCGNTGGEDAEDASLPQGTAVEVIEAESGPMSAEYSLTGKIAAVNEVNVFPLLAGQVLSLPVKEGDKVNQGQLLFTVDTSTVTSTMSALQQSYSATQAATNSSIASAQIGLQSAQAGLDSAQANLNATQATLQSAQAGVDAAQTGVDAAQTAYDNAVAMYEAGASAAQDVEAAERGLVQANAQLEQAKAGLAQAEAQAASAQAGMDSAQASAAQARESTNQARAQQSASLAQIQANMDQINSQARLGTVSAPCAGTITAVNLTRGSVASSAQPAVVIAEDSKVEVQVSVAEDVFSDIKAGDTVSVVIPVLSDDPINGTVASLPAAANAQTNLYDISITLPGTAKPPIGSFATVTFYTNRRDNTLYIPTEAILTGNDNEQFVYIVDDYGDGDTASRLPVETGLVSKTDTEILSGLEAGDRVVVKGQSYLSDGMGVRVVTGEDTSSAEPSDGGSTEGGEANAS